MKIFVAVFSGTVGPTKLNLDSHMDKGLLYRVKRNQEVKPIYNIICFVFCCCCFFFLFFFVLFCFVFLLLFFSSNVQILKFPSHFYLKV